MNHTFPLQPTLENDWVRLSPLHENHWQDLYSIASDPLLWAQHPCPDRYQEAVFRNYFQGALESGGAFLVESKQTNRPVGCTRFYDYQPELDLILIGYTFIGREWWGMPYNRSAKLLMLDHALAHVSAVHFHIGVNNLRSQKAIGKIGAIKVGEMGVAYHGEQSNPNYIYEMNRAGWAQHRAAVYQSIIQPMK